jgi:pimeloyl-ACP methyl ester carboxylesterase
MDRLGIVRAAIVGWSDGGDTGLAMAHDTPDRVTGVFFFACNVDATGTIPFAPTPVIDRIYAHHVADYARLSPMAGGFERMRDDLGVMQGSQPNYSPADLAAIRVPVWAVLGEHDEFIKREHMEYVARAIPGATLRILPDVSHFAPLQRPDAFNAVVLEFLAAVSHQRN